MGDRTYKHRLIRYQAYKDKDGKWTATAVVYTDEGHSMTGKPVTVRGTFTMEEDALRTALRQAKEWIDAQAPLKQ